jgi:hypothetical protein
MLTNGFISLHRSLLKWEWYDDINTTRLFIHLLLTVNHYDETWRGIKIMRGQILTSTAKLSRETRLSVRQIRVAMTHLISTNEVTIKTTPQHTVITISQYDKYQRVTNKMTEERQTNDKAVTNERQLSNKANKANKEINNNSVDFSCPEDIRLTVDEFIEYRRLKKSPMNSNSVKLLLQKLASFTDDYEIQKQILNESMINGWTGIFKPKDVQPVNNSKVVNGVRKL